MTSDAPSPSLADAAARGARPSVVIRVDASDVMGSGHVMRCLTLADALRRHGAAITFVSREHAGHLLALVESHGHDVRRLPASPRLRPIADGDYAAWLGVSEDHDAAETIDALDGMPGTTDWLIVDHYGVGPAWEAAVRPHVRRILAIDDLGRSHDCDALLDQNWHGDRAAARYAKRVPADCVRLLGPRYALLRPEYHALHDAPRPRDGAVERVLVFFGGSDHWDMNATALAALSTAECAHLQVDLVVGGTQPLSPRVEEAARARKHTTIHRGLPSLAPLMAAADLGLGAVGGCTWERMCAGLPTLAVSIADNQVPAAETLDRDGFIIHAGRADVVDPDALGGHLRRLLSSAQMRQRLASAGRRLVDGLGTARCCRHLLCPTGLAAIGL